MNVSALCLDQPGVRLGWALGGSFALHLAVLMPLGEGASISAPPPLPPLMVQLPEPALASALALTSVAQAVEEAVSPAPTFPAPKPESLRGKALATATAALSQELFYPREAIERGLTGRVILLLRLDAAGRVLAAEVASSSGHTLLDAAAVQAAGKITALAGHARQVLLPVDFQLD